MPSSTDSSRESDINTRPMFYVKVKRDKIDKCNICLTKTALSWDHIPPKGSIELAPVEMESIFHLFIQKPENARLAESQNGLKYRTICPKCNAKIGQKYDVVIKDFANSVGRYLNSTLRLPPSVKHRTKPVALMRGILAHLLAAKIKLDDGDFDNTLRELIRDESLPIPPDIFVHYWTYPYEQIVVLRDFAIASLKSHRAGFFNTIKYFPIAYLISSVPDFCGLPELTAFRNCNVDEEVDIPIILEKTAHPFWPEAPDADSVIVFGQEAVNAIRAKRKK